jgi:hypothetical protein
MADLEITIDWLNAKESGTTFSDLAFVGEANQYLQKDH